MPALLPSTSRSKTFEGPNLKVMAGACTIRGRDRTNNEDCEYISPENDLFIVSDGMGGHAAGEMASRLVIDALTHELGRIHDDPHSETEIKQLVRKALDDANCLILDMGEPI